MNIIHRFRFTYAKLGDCRFISHLDLSTAVSRALKRADLPVAYTEGFSPRPRTAFGPPLPLFVEGERELGDVEFQAMVEPDVVVDKMNGLLQQGIQLLEGRYVPTKAQSITACIRQARYRVAPRSGEWAALTPSRVAEILSHESIVIEKESKGNKKQVDIRPGIVSLAAVDGGLDAELSASPARSVNIFDMLGVLDPGLTAATSAHLRIVRTGFICEEPGEPAAS